MKRQAKLKLRLLAFTLFFSVSFTAGAQSAYDDYKLSDKTFKHQEDFDTPSGWETNEPGRRSAETIDGALVFKSFNDNTQVKYKTVNVDWTGDWELEIGVRWLSGKETSAIDFLWDKEAGNSNKFHFGFTGSGKYVLAEFKDSSYDHIINFKEASFVNKRSTNNLTVRKVRQTYYLFINERLVKTMAYKPVKGDMIGITVPPNSAIKIEYLYAFELGLSSKVTTSSRTSAGYNSYSSAEKTTVYREDFNSSSSTWEVYRSGERMGKINNGVYDWISMNDNAQMIKHTLTDMDWSRDWQIEVRMKHLTGKPNSSNDLLWNVDSSSDRYHFGFTGQGKYVLSNKTASGYESIVPFTESSIVNKDGFNKVTVRKVGSQYEYFFNEQLITTKYNHTVSSNKLGLMTPPNSTLQVDYLEVVYLNPKVVKSSSTAGNQYFGVMTKYSGYGTQRWKTRDEFPKDAISTDWEDGYYVSDVSFDNNKWTLVSSKGTEYTDQRWRTRFDFPKDDIKELWNAGFKITELNYGNGVWAMVMSENSGYSMQRWSTRASFPTDKIKEFRDEGYYISELVYGKDRWALVSSKDEDILGQVWSKSNDFPKDKIQNNLEAGYNITQLSYENKLWVLVMTKYTSRRPQQWFSSTDFPKTEIREYWKQGYAITDITYASEGVSKSQDLSKNSKKGSGGL